MADVDYAGWALKQGSKLPTWKRRYFVLRGRELRYFMSPGHSGHGMGEKGRVVVMHVDGSRARETGGGDAVLLLKCERKLQPLKMKPENAEEMHKWLRILETVVMRYEREVTEGRMVAATATTPVRTPLAPFDPFGDPRMVDDDEDDTDDDPGTLLDADGDFSDVESYYQTGVRGSYFSDNSRTLAQSSLAFDLDHLDDDEDESEVFDDMTPVIPVHTPVSRSASVAREAWALVGYPEEANHRWMKRYTILAGRSLRYYASKGGHTPLETVTISRASLSKTRANALDLTTTQGRVFAIAADSHDELILWDHAVAEVLGTKPLVNEPEEAVDVEAGGFHRYMNVESINNAMVKSFAKMKAGVDLIAHASPNRQVICEGYLSILDNDDPGPGRWKEHYFILKGTMLEQRDAASSPVDNVYEVVGVNISNNATATDFEIELESGRALLRAQNISDRARWVRSLYEARDGVVAPTSGKASHTTKQTSFFPSFSSSSELTETVVHYKQKSGWLLKGGFRKTSWKKRYFVLEGDTLQFFDKPDSVVPKGSGIVFSVVRNTSAENAADVHFVNGRIVRIAADTKDVIDDWFTALQQATELSFHGTNDTEDDSTGPLQVSSTNRQHGWLLKRGQLVKSWKRRYFQLERNRLMYYGTADGDLLGSGIVFDVSVGDQRPFCLDVRFQNGRLLHAVAANEDDFSQWFEALQSASNISETFMSRHSTAHDSMIFDKEFDFDGADDIDNDFASSDNEWPASGYGDPDSDEELGTGGYATWTAAMKDEPQRDSTSSWDSSFSEHIYDDVFDEDSDNDLGPLTSGRERRPSDASSTHSETRGCSGWLQKEGATVKSWKRRYFTLHGVKLSYFKSRNGSLLRSYAVCEVEELSSLEFGLAVSMIGGRRLVVKADNNEEYQKWLLALWESIADGRASRSNSRHSLVDDLVEDNTLMSSSAMSDAKAQRTYSGWLEKEGRRFKTWKRRYFTFKNGALIYYNDVGGVAHGNGIVTGVFMDTTKANTLSVQLRGGRVLRVSAASVAEMDIWFQVLSTSRESSAETVASSDFGSYEGQDLMNSRSSATSPAHRKLSAASAPRANPGPTQTRGYPTRLDPGDYLANDTITNESFLRIKAMDGSDMRLTNSTQVDRRHTFKGELNFTDVAPIFNGEPKQRIDSESDEDLEYMRVLHTEDEIEEAKRLQHNADTNQPTKCAPCCVVM